MKKGGKMITAFLSSKEQQFQKTFFFSSRKKELTLA